MLNFLNTAVLAALAAALLPFLLHLFSKRKVKVVPFSSITFLKAMQKRQVRAIKIKQVLLLVVRTLIILAVVFAFARPSTRGGYLGSHASVSAVIVLDNSASMGLSVKDGRLFDLAVRRAGEILAQMGQEDEVAVMTTVGDDAAVSGAGRFGNAAAARTVLDKIALADGRADLSQTYTQAATLIAHRPNLNREIYLLSDCQDNSFRHDQPPPHFEGKTFLVDLPVGKIDNASIAGVDFGNQLIEVGVDFAVSAAVKKRSGPDDDILVSLYMDSVKVAQQSLQLKAGESGAVPFTVRVGSPGYHSGYVALSDDDLLADNVWHFAFHLPEQFGILLVGDDETSSRLIRLALTPDETAQRHWTVEQTGYDRFASVDLSRFNVVLLAGYGRMPAAAVSRLKEFVKAGGGLMIDPGRSIDIEQFNRDWVDLTGVTLLSGYPPMISRAGYYLLGSFDLRHQILTVFQNVDKTALPPFRSYIRLKAAPVPGRPMEVLARWSDGSPGITATTYGQGRIMYFGCDIAPDISDISLHPAFVPLLVRSAEYLSSRFSAYNETIAAGAAPRRDLRGATNPANEYTLVAPDGRRRLIAGSAGRDVVVADCGRLDRTGVYSILSEDRECDRFAVNGDPDEGDLYRPDRTELAGRLVNMEAVPYAADLAGFITEKRFGRELWQYFLLAAVILLLVEMYIARDRGNNETSGE
ncbi:MAG: BatA domain-containing protein [candidate division Zixibacteria bacterium]|nr:BatA domain-containing protein [candidate division Zixibacteria bacterium]